MIPLFWKWRLKFRSNQLWICRNQHLVHCAAGKLENFHCPLQQLLQLVLTWLKEQVREKSYFKQPYLYLHKNLFLAIRYELDQDTNFYIRMFAHLLLLLLPNTFTSLLPHLSFCLRDPVSPCLRLPFSSVCPLGRRIPHHHHQVQKQKLGNDDRSRFEGIIRTGDSLDVCFWYNEKFGLLFFVCFQNNF